MRSLKRISNPAISSKEINAMVDQRESLNPSHHHEIKIYSHAVCEANATLPWLTRERGVQTHGRQGRGTDPFPVIHGCSTTACVPEQSVALRPYRRLQWKVANQSFGLGFTSLSFAPV